MKNYTQVYVKNSFEAAETYCKAFGAEITREFCCEHSEMTRYYFHELSQDFSVCWQMTYFDFKSPDYVA